MRCTTLCYRYFLFGRATRVSSVAEEQPSAEGKNKIETKNDGDQPSIIHPMLA